MTERIDTFAARLSDANAGRVTSRSLHLSLLTLHLAVALKLNVATELRDNLEMFSSGQLYPYFLRKLLPVFTKILEGPPVFVTNPEHKLRSCILEVLHRLPNSQSEHLKPHALHIVDLLLSLVRTENEDNAILCMKAVMDLERHQAEATSTKVQPFLDLIQEMFEAMENVVQETFDSSSLPPGQGSLVGGSQSFQSPRPGSPATSAAVDIGIDTPAIRPLLKGMQSFKVFAECPIIVVSLFQTHRNCVTTNVKKFVPLIKKVLSLQAAPQARAHAEAAERKEVFIGVSKDIKNRHAFGEFLTAQVKMMSFLAYLLRVYQQQLQDFLSTLPDIVIRLLRDCPSEKSATRKELLVAIRHTINFQFRTIFLSRLDDLLDERTLLGDGLTVYESMRPLAYSLLADLIHHVREKLTREQICKTVAVFSKNLHDNFPGTSFQTMSAKLLLNLAEVIANLEDKQDARRILIDILNAIACKFADMNHQYENAVKLSKDCSNTTIDSVPEDHLADASSPPVWDNVDIFLATPIRLSNPKDRGANPVEDNKFLFKNLLTGLKGMFYQLKVSNPVNPTVEAANAPANWPEVSHGYSAEEVEVIKKLFREGAHLFRYYSLEKPFSETNFSNPVEFLTNNYGVQSGKEEKDLLETFATVFHSIDPATFYEVFHTEIPILYEMMFEHPALLHVPQFFLASEATSPAFAGMLLQFLMDRINEIGTSDMKRSAILLRMFKLSFMAVTLFSQQNEQILLPHVTKIVTQSIQLSTIAAEPMNYFYLLRSLFRSIGGGRFELLYKEILPLLEMLLEVLNNLLMAARKPQERDLYVELCLTVPARLSNLLPHLSYLMRPLVVALRAGSDLVGQGLRTLELCVDNLTAEYLDPIMAPVIDDLMSALWDHLKPAPYSHFHSHITMRILGKLGGRNRKFMNRPPDLKYQQCAGEKTTIDIRLTGSSRDRAFPATLGIDLAISKLSEVPKAPPLKRIDPYYKQQAFRLIAAQVKLHIGFDNLPDDLPQALRLQATDLLESNYDNSSDSPQLPDRERSIAKCNAQQETLEKLLKACILATTLPDVESLAKPFLGDICRHFAILEIGRALSHARRARKGFDVMAGEGPLCLDSRVLANAISESLSSDRSATREAAESCMKMIHSAAGIILGSPQRVDRFPFFSHLTKLFCHKCHEEDWYVKAGGGLGINLLATTVDLGDDFFIAKQIELVKSLMYIIKDTPLDLPALTRDQAFATLEILLRKCNRDASKEALGDDKSSLYHLCTLLITDLMHQNKHVRNAAQKAFDVIGKVIGAEVADLLIPVKERLLQTIYMKPLRALPFQVQIGYIDAISYCLETRYDIIEINDIAHRLFLEAMSLADADDASLSTKSQEYKTAQQIVDLRVSCIRLLALALGTSDYSSPQQTQTRSRIIAVFFKSLYSSSIDVIEAANTGLKGVLLQTNKLPKDLLQNGLRPILMNLQDPTKLTEQGLDGLARLLALLTNYFKTEIGERLMGHMKAIASQTVLQKSSFMLIEQNAQMKVVIAILNVFHLLPPTATMFMRELVDRVLELEQNLRRTLASPLREPLLKYINRYPSESWEFFRDKLGDMKYGRFLSQILSSPWCEPLREEIRSKIQDLLKLAFSAEGDSCTAAAINGVHVIHCLLIDDPEWIRSQPDLREQLLRAGKELHVTKPAVPVPTALILAATQASKKLMEIFVTYMKIQRDDLDFLFQLIETVTAEEIAEEPSFQSFIYEQIIESDSIEYWRSVVTRTLELYTFRNSSPRTKTFAFKYLLNPIFAMDTLRSSQAAKAHDIRRPLIDKGVVESVHNKIWKTQNADLNEETAQPGVDHSRLELLQMTALLLKYHDKLIAETRKDIMKFGWSHIKLEDVVNKHATYVMIAYFVAQYDTPAKITTQIYQALLKAHQNEGRSLVVQALDLIAPRLPDRLKGQSDPRYPLWARWPKRILSEDNSNLQQLIGIYQFMVRYPDLFYEAREHFVPQIIPALSKIAQLPTPSNEHKKLVLNLIQMILKWEERRVGKIDPPALQSAETSPPARRRTQPTNSPSQTHGQTPNHERSDYTIPTTLKSILIKYLTQFIGVIPERYPTPAFLLRDLDSKNPVVQLPPSDMAKKALGLFFDLLSLESWSDLDVDLFPRISESILASDKTERGEEKTVTGIINILQVIRIVINFKKDEWILSQLPLIQKLLDKVIKFDNPEVQDCLHESDKGLDGERTISALLPRILQAIPQESKEDDEMEVDAPETTFVNFVFNAATSTMEGSNLVASINLFSTLSITKPEKMEPHIQIIMRALQGKLAKDQVTAVPVPGGQPLAPGSKGPDGNVLCPDQREFEISSKLTVKAIDIISSRINDLGDQRRPFLSVLASLLERSPNVKLCEKILELCESWVFDSTHAFPTLKEKNAVLHKMLLFEGRADDGLLHKFLDLVIRIYEDPKITRTELTVRLEHAFLIGTRAMDVDMRNRFMNIFHRSLTKTASARLIYVLTQQNWDTLAETFWLSQAIQLIFGAIETSTLIQLNGEDFTMMSPAQLFTKYSTDARKNDLMLDDQYEDFMAQHRNFYATIGDVKAGDLLEPLCHLQHTDYDVAYQTWVAIFPLCWSLLSPDDRRDLEKGLVSLLTKDYHQRQLDRRPNVVQALLEGAVRAKPKCKVPPQVMKWLTKTFDAWYTAAISLEEQVIIGQNDTAAVRESHLDALIEIYASLKEDDFFYGTWRRRCRFVETNSALSYEQMGMFDKAQDLYEAAQIKARTGAVPYSKGEYMLWEDHWLLCAQKLQQWEILQDFAKHENYNDLHLEAAWRTNENWTSPDSLEQLNSTIKAVSDAPTPRRTFFQAFITLLKFYDTAETSRDYSQTDFQRICDESIQLSIRKWHQLPKRITDAHVPILQNFQQLVELHDASVISISLAQTNSTNLDAKSQELKLLLGMWRDRLPNIWDDINAWQDLVTWRQHIFGLINRKYLNLLGPQPGNASGNSYAYRGFHETAWIINRFAHVARKHQLPEVCISQLSRIYTLPNIEIQEAFLKLREQAKCHYQNQSELNSGLDVINNTNLNYFGNQQKAEFFTLKGMFLAKLGQKDEANDAYGTALYHDIRLPKAWAEWGFYNDMKFKANPSDIQPASEAVSCYLEAAGLYKNAKSRKLLSRILWLLSVDDSEGHIMQAFEDFKGETPVWYWTTFIPQLLTSLSHREARVASNILMRIASMYPQALFFPLRTVREDLLLIKKAEDARQQQKAKQSQQQSPNSKSQSTPEHHQGSPNGQVGGGSRPGTANSDKTNGAENPKPEQNGDVQSSTEVRPESAPKRPWEHAQEINDKLKTTFPLLAYSMESMVDQVQKHFKCPPDEDAYRLIVALLNDGLNYIARNPNAYAQDFKLPQGTEANIRKFAETILPIHIRGSFEADFVSTKPTMYEYIHRLRKWRDKFEEKLDRRDPTANLEAYGHVLSEFKFAKFHDVEIPGQYLQHRDKNTDFIRIERFLPNVELVRTCGISHRRIKIRGQDGSVHSFAVQHPTARHSRREERILQLFRIFNGTLSKRKESRRRNLNFTLPLMQPLSPSIRLIQDDASYVSLQGIFEDYCRRTSVNKDDPILFTMEKMRAGHSPNQSADSVNALRMEIFSAIRTKWVPPDLVLKYFQAIYPNFADFFLFRKQFSYQLASLTFLTYIMHMSARWPNKLNISRATGNVWGSELIPALATQRPIFGASEFVPFRMTPNLQTLMGPLATEGLFASALMAIALCLTQVHDQGGELEQQLSIFVRDEMIFWHSQQRHTTPSENQLREYVQNNVDSVVKKAISLALPPERNLPANQTVVDLVAKSVDPKALAAADALWMGYL
ncbi:uncharacterized protein KY384_005354 [Bacidia gigantensis]|uniref:uncharacterized protein n=1 Tax=Bacidia gigantensis TaxID=2732470 RepID=UPI001D04DC66|nr:uncharacterized protein KY384_005354 [Bacidia gigantensis]KAG8529873.1 hypothetical protein KY384_005354 [Bacidia gigantensis]